MDRDREALSVIESHQNDTDSFLKLARKYQDMEELTPTMINELVSKIEVRKAEGKGAKRTQEVDVYLNYIGHFEVPQEPEVLTEEEMLARQQEEERLERKRASNRRYMKKHREMIKKPLAEQNIEWDLVNKEDAKPSLSQKEASALREQRKREAVAV